MESATDAADAADRLKHEYLRLRREMRENDKRIEAARRQNASQVCTLNQLLHQRTALAHEVCQFAHRFTDAYPDHRDSLVELQSLRHLFKANHDHIRGLTTAIANLQDEPAAAGRPADAADSGPAAGDERSAADPQLRPKQEFVERVWRCANAAKNEDDDGKLRRANRSKHAEGDLAAPRHRHAAGPPRKTKASGGAPSQSRLGASPTAEGRRPPPAFSPLLCALVVAVAVSSAPFLCPDALWLRILDKCRRASVSQPPLPPASPMSVLQRARKFCGL